MAAAVLPLPWQRRRARQHSPTNSSPPSSWIKGTSDIIKREGGKKKGEQWPNLKPDTGLDVREDEAISGHLSTAETHKHRR